MTPHEARALWDKQWRREYLLDRSRIHGVRAAEYSEKARELRAKADEWDAGAADETRKAGEDALAASAIEPLTLDQMGALFAYSEGRGPEPAL